MFYLTTLSFGKIIRFLEQKKGRGIRNIGKMRPRAKPELLGKKPLVPSFFSPQIPNNLGFMVERRHCGTCYRSIIISNFTYIANLYYFFGHPDASYQ
jgi:hypothetical protein